MEDSSLGLELNDADGLVHLCHQLTGLFVEVVITFQDNRHELLARVITIHFESEGGKGHQVDTITLFQCGKIGVAQTQSQNITDTGIIASGCTHPQDIVVAPLDIP